MTVGPDGLDWERDGVCLVPQTPGLTAWATAAGRIARDVFAARRDVPGHLRHGGTWFVGLDALPNASDGSIAGQPLRGAWQDRVPAPPVWHPAQLSVVLPGYPGRDAGDSDAALRYRQTRGAAHLDGLHAIGPAKRRFLREPHGFVLGLPLDGCGAAPLLVWPGSHRALGAALRQATAGRDPATVDLTDSYTAARRAVLDSIAPLPLRAPPGAGFLLHRHLLHGTDVWRDTDAGEHRQRMIAFFRPLLPALDDWLAA